MGGNRSMRKRIVAVHAEYRQLSDADKEIYIDEWCKQSIEDGFGSLEKLLEKTAGIYCVGNAVSMADCCLIPQIFNAMRYKVNVEKYANIYRIFINAMHTKPFRDAQPNRQPDAPRKSKL